MCNETNTIGCLSEITIIFIIKLCNLTEDSAVCSCLCHNREIHIFSLNSSVIPALYSNLDASQDVSLMDQFTSDTQMQVFCILSLGKSFRHAGGTD